MEPSLPIFGLPQELCLPQTRIHIKSPLATDPFIESIQVQELKRVQQAWSAARVFPKYHGSLSLDATLNLVVIRNYVRIWKLPPDDDMQMHEHKLSQAM
jgi:hypothetical protein